MVSIPLAALVDALLGLAAALVGFLLVVTVCAVLLALINAVLPRSRD